MFSETRYAMNGDLRVAYRASPAGARDIVFVPNWFTCCEILPELPSVQGWVEAMTSLGRLIFLDLPGSGASDPVTPGTLTTLEQWADSITAVLDDLGSSEAAALFAATYPSRTTALVVLQCLAALASDAESHREAGRLFGAADALRRRIGIVRYKVYDADYDVSVGAVRAALGDSEFESAWAEGSALSTDEAIAYAQRGRGERKRPTSGWAALTPAERDVVRLVSEGLGNKDIGTRLFISPRTVQTHLTHVYTKLGLTSRVQLVQEAAQHA
jgi:DNA-binding CsgD family transcriptional regulator